MDVPRVGDEWMGSPGHFLWLMLWRLSRIKINLREELHNCSQVLLLGVSKSLVHRAFVECINEKDEFSCDFLVLFLFVCIFISLFKSYLS